MTSQISIASSCTHMTDMCIEFSSSALPALDALSSADRRRVLEAARSLSHGIDRDLQVLRSASPDSISPLYMLRAGGDIRLLLERSEGQWRVLDIIRKSAMVRLSGREVH